MKCHTKYCRKTAKNGNFCYSCVIRKYKERNPEKYAYFVLRNNAKRRGKSFSITFQDFLDAVRPTKYMKGRGKTATSLHLDRKKEKFGYVPGNLQILTNTANLTKYLTFSYNEKGKPTNFKTQTKREETSEEHYPF